MKILFAVWLKTEPMSIYYGNALQAAVSKGKENIIRYLVEHEANVNSKGRLLKLHLKQQCKAAIKI
jgi:phage shock protein A